MRKLLSIVLIFILLISLFACNKDDEFIPKEINFEPFGEDAGREVFVNYKDFEKLSEITNEITIGRYEIDTIDLTNELVVYKDEKDVSSQYSKVYYIKKFDGEDIIPVTTNTDYVSCSIDNNIIILMTQDNLYTIYNNNGKKIGENINNVDSIRTVGEKHFRIDFNNDRTQVYHIEEGAIFNNETAYPYLSDEIVSFSDKYLMIQTIDGYINIVNNIGSLVFYYRNSNDVNNRIEYLGNDRFLIITNTLGNSKDYDALIDEKYYKQSIFIYEAILDKTYQIEYDYYIYSFWNKYNSPSVAIYLKNNYNYMSIYNLNQNKTLKTENPYIVYIVNEDLTPCIRIQDNVYQYLYFKEDYAIENNRREAKVIGLDANKIWESEDSINNIYHFNDGAMVVGKRIEREQLRGVYDIQGNLIIDFEYNELSAFVEGYAIGEINGIYYRVDKNNNRTLINKDVLSIGYGTYIIQENDYQLLYNNNGDAIIDESMGAKELSVYTDRNNKTYIAVTDMSDNIKLYKVE